ncbi:MAG TPA: phosphate/phosphite/phosphonate ABC transporter substrate-binding protein [Acidimicrobiales bacterium]|nr:phosphate/phosphite/phosphonate ABC transporter substrate-binding protein [Acidimicrobiales bacterium]
MSLIFSSRSRLSGSPTSRSRLSGSRLSGTGRTRAALAAMAALFLLVLTACGSTSASTSGNSTSGGGSGSGGSGHNSKHPGWPSTLTYGAVGAENSTSLTNSLKPLAEVVKKQLGVTLKVVTGTSYASMIEAQQAGKAQIIGYGPFSYFIAKKEGLKIQDIGILITAPHTDGGYYSWAVVNPKKTPSITSIKDFKGKKVCFSDPSSTSGYLYPSYGLLGAGISPTKGVTPVFAGTDTATALQVAKGSCQVGFTNSQSLPAAEEAHQISPSAVKIVWKGPEIPGNPTAISDSVPASLRTALENLLIKDGNSKYFAAHGYCPSVAKCNELTGGWGYANPKVADFSKIANVCKITKSPQCKA